MGEGTGRLLETVLEAQAGRVSKTGLCAPRNQQKRKRETERERKEGRKKNMGTQALMEQRCFNEFSVSIYKLWYKKFLTTMIKIRKPSV